MKLAIKGENADDWKHFYGAGRRSSPPELASGPLFTKRKGVSAQSRYLNEANM
ncbi:hypothetical protein [Mesobacillus thioparans]|uniref:hypothetical protein n=1 Tax=Mesobacillus thioparans TaxID=370439 RepID=UPI0039EFCB3A